MEWLLVMVCVAFVLLLVFALALKRWLSHDSIDTAVHIRSPLRE